MKRSIIVVVFFLAALLSACGSARSGAIEKNAPNIDKSKAERLYLKAVNLYKEGQLDAAIVEYIDAIESDPTEASYYSDLAEAYRALGKNEVAIIFLERAIALDPKMANARTTLGVIYEDKGQLNKSIECHLKAIKADPDNAIARNNLGHAYQTAGKEKEAEQSYRKAIEINPKFAPAFDNLGVLLMNQRRADDGITMIKKAIVLSSSKNPQLGIYYNDLGAAYIMKRRRKDACEAFEKARELLPDNPDVKKNLKNIAKYCSKEKSGFDDGTIYDGLQGEF